MTWTRIKQFFLPFGILAGTIIGAGVFSLPYIFRFSGISLGLIYLVIGSAAYIVVYRMYADIVRETPGDHRFVGYSRIYLGNRIGWLAILMTIIESILVLTIYLVLSESFAHLLVRAGAGVEKIIIFWFLASAAILLGLKKIAKIELAITSGILAIFAIVFFFGAKNIGALSVVDIVPVWGNLFWPLSAVLFSLSGRVAIPAVVKLGGPTNKVIFWGVAVPALVYGLFAFSVIAISPIVTEDAVTGLRAGIPYAVSWLVGVLGILSLISSYITVGYDVEKSLEYDLRTPYTLRFAMVMFGPILLYFGGLKDFLYLVGLTGGIFIALESIFIVWMWLKMKGRRMSVGAAALIVLFAVALGYEILKGLL
ncbi:MAG: hypothetical protein Q7S83_02695 [bacterium]|nr:hypothetical protein [bacterium]